MALMKEGNAGFTKTQIETLSDEIDVLRASIKMERASRDRTIEQNVRLRREIEQLQRHVMPEKQKLFKVFAPGGLAVNSFSGNEYTVYSVDFCADQSKAYVMANERAEEILGVMGAGCYKVEI